MRKLFELLRSKGLISRKGVSREAIARLSKMNIIDLAEQLVDMTRLTDRQAARAVGGHYASTALGGGREPCYRYECRRGRLDQLVRFAGLYSDRAHLRNFFGDYAPPDRAYEGVHSMPAGAADSPNEEDLKYSLWSDIALSLHIKPLLESGILRFVTPSDHICADCLGEAIGLGKGSGGKFRNACSRLATGFLENTKYVLLKAAEAPTVHVNGPKRFYEHGGRILVYDQLPEAVELRPRILARYETGEPVLLSRTLSRELRLHDGLALEVIRNVAHSVDAALSLGTSLVTNRELDLSFLAYAETDRDMAQRNTFAQRYLTTLVPFLADVPTKDILEIRQREGDSFLAFRSQLNRAIESFRDRGVTLTAKTAQQIYSDIIAPELARLEKKVKTAKRDLVSAVTRPLAGVMGVLTFGMLSGVVPAEAAHLMQAAGVAVCGADALTKAMALGDGERAIENEGLYFLWKVKKAAKKRKRSS